MGVVSSVGPVYQVLKNTGNKPLKKFCDHDYEEVSSPHDMDGETYVCKHCGDRYRLYYEDMK